MVRHALPNVRCWENSGKHLLAASISAFDPQRTSASNGGNIATGEEPMSDDPDFPKANHALQMLRRREFLR
jgi:hypothetical protein